MNTKDINKRLQMVVKAESGWRRKGGGNPLSKKLRVTVLECDNPEIVGKQFWIVAHGRQWGKGDRFKTMPGQCFVLLAVIGNTDLDKIHLKASLDSHKPLNKCRYVCEVPA